eukprot:1195725-Prorocentrum_minimum.AAC.3
MYVTEDNLVRCCTTETDRVYPERRLNRSGHVNTEDGKDASGPVHKTSSGCSKGASRAATVSVKPVQALLAELPQQPSYGTCRLQRRCYKHEAIP